MLIDISTKLLVFVTLSVSFLQGSSAVSNHQRYRRQVPQEWAHAKVYFLFEQMQTYIQNEVILVDKMLKLDNPLNIDHPIFSLSSICYVLFMCRLGDKAAAKGMGKLDKKNIDCFQKVVADTAFKNAKKSGNKEGQEAAIIFASVEKNTKSVGVASPPCKSMKMDSPEIERLIQHQDAASEGAKENNKKSALLAALSLKQIGSDPLLALNTGTFKAGDPKNPKNGRGESCDDDKDTTGCIYTKKLLVEDVTKEEIEAFLKQNDGTGGSDSKSTDTSGNNDSKEKPGAAPADTGDKGKTDTEDKFHARIWHGIANWGMYKGAEAEDSPPVGETSDKSERWLEGNNIISPL
ncbi:hypothetical protein VP01_1386g4 [Puccinia sorghi]|uniref:Uncharacterized protein n=1 Tax=Puccinia sorghi TaxID=27349 RepID=A0A0L6VL89_9BASI|nr:hypothetical protein VP01_1386g4 [Puccinia sorghi]